MRTVARALVTAAVTGVGVVSAVTPTAAAPPPASAPYSCGIRGNTTIGGTFGDAGLIGWQSDKDGVVACLGGSFYVRDGKNATYGYGAYDNSPTRWTLADGYLPASVTAFHRSGASVTITNFGDKVTLGDHAYVVVYSRVRVANPTAHAVSLDPEPTEGLVPLSHAATSVPAHSSVDHDYAVAADRFGGTYAWPSDSALTGTGGFAGHYAHMRSYWNGQLATITALDTLPDRKLVDAYKSGFIYTQIIRDGNKLTTGENNYDEEFSHDVIGIYASLLTEGYFADAHALLTRARYVIGSQRQYDDGVWKYPWLWALYLQKSGDTAFVKANFAAGGPQGADTPSIEATAHQIAAARTGPGGIIEATNDIDANGLWTIDDYSALMGLASYRWLAQQVGNTTEARWAAAEYTSLLAAVNKTLTATITRYHLNYLPCSMTAPNDDNRCSNPEDANWAAPFLFGRWAWDGYLFGAKISGPGASLIDATYTYGFKRLAGKLPADTFGGYSPDFYSTGYNAGYGSWGLASSAHRDQGIDGYEFMIEASQSGPYSWWESSGFPNPGSPWQGVHPGDGQGSAPHAWGIANANKVLLDSLVAQRGDGALIVGRGVPDSWVRPGKRIALSNFPTTGGHRIGVDVRTAGRSVTLRLATTSVAGTAGSSDRRSGPVLFQLPAFVRNIASASTGSVDQATGTVTISATTRSVIVVLRHAVS